MEGEELKIYSLIYTFNFAARKHTNQRRKNKDQTPYIEHPIAVCEILSNAGVKDTNVLEAALLHDTVEDTDTTFTELELHFSKDIVQYVREVTDDKSLPKVKRKQLQIEHAKTASYGARLIKIADKIHNLRTLVKDPPPDWDKARVLGYFVWSKQVTDNCWHDDKSVEMDVLYNYIYNLYKSNIPAGTDEKKILQEYYESLK